MALFNRRSFVAYVGRLKGTGVSEQWESHVAKVGGKAFALLAADGSQIVFKVTELSFDGLTSLEDVRQAAYFAKRQWVAVGRGAPLSDAELKGYIAASYDLVAAKLTRKLRAELGIGEA
jgi:predicted DNA-binding protein (MmcQ/YjbR family)